MASPPLETRPRRHGLAAEERRAYAEDGFFIRKAVFVPDEIETLRAAGERVVSRADAAACSGRDYCIDGNRYVEAASETIQFEHNDAARTIRVIEPFHHLDPVFDRLIDDLRIVEPMCDVIGSEGVALWTDKINLKRPLEGSAFRWHQDSPYWTHACDDVDRLPNVMVTLDDADEENGCFRVVRGSHRHGCLPGIQDGSTLGVLFTDPDHFDESKQVPAIAPAGSLVFFSPHTVHGSQPNHSKRPRRAMVLTYQPANRPMFKVDGTRNAGAPLES
jgi:ectoine hydroxylase-related dioxygenase (phytanoyl-CoA dioxygenase family)